MQTLAEVARLLGTRPSGLIATYRSLRQSSQSLHIIGKGVAAAQRVLRGVMIGLFRFAGFSRGDDESRTLWHRRKLHFGDTGRLGDPQVLAGVDAPTPCNLVTLMSIFDLPKCFRYRFASNRQRIV